jgi:hypothetical protein
MECLIKSLLFLPSLKAVDIFGKLVDLNDKPLIQARALLGLEFFIYLCDVLFPNLKPYHIWMLMMEFRFFLMDWKMRLNHVRVLEC